MKKNQYLSPSIEEMAIESECFIAQSVPSLENPVHGNNWNW